MGVKYEDVPCDSYTYRGRSRSMRRVITAADLARSSVHTTKSPDATDREWFAPARSWAQGGL